jgi:hypothetical protein
VFDVKHPDTIRTIVVVRAAFASAASRTATVSRPAKRPRGTVVRRFAGTAARAQLPAANVRAVSA